MKRCYHVVAIPIRIVVNTFGDYNPNGYMYVLKENESKVRELVRKNPFTPVDLVQPLVIRANEGDEVEILFENKVHFNTGMHFQDVSYDVQEADGAAVGLNEDTTVAPGEKIVYRIIADQEGISYFSDLGNPSSSEEGSNGNGLFGALFVQKRFSWWTDPVTGKTINSGVDADIHHPLLPSHREYAWIFHDEMEINDLTGNNPVDPMTNQETESFHGVNYRYEPLHRRQQLIEEGVVGPGTDGEEVHHDSWVFGDPASPILKGYVGDPARIQLVHGGVKETHVFHYHVHQWLSDQSNIESNIIDAQAVSPQSNYTIDPLYGLGSLQGSYGDAIVHCHLYPHFMVGMWGMNRVFDTLQDGSQCYPNGEKIKALQPLPDRPAPPAPTKERPGFPNFIPGKVGYKAPRPPLGIKGGRGLTELEANAAVPNARPGAVFSDPTPPGTKVIEFNVSLIELPIVYNKQGWNDPKGRIYVKDEDKEDVLAGRKDPEPLVIHTPANVAIRVHFTNCLPSVLDGDAFQLVTRTYESGMHIHFVKFDQLVCDGSNIGWNYDTSVLPGQTITYEYFADVELKAWFFHDHIFAVVDQPHGVFGSGVVHSRFSSFFDSETGETVDHGTQISVTNPLIPDYRDLALFAQDFALLFDAKGNPIQPPAFPGSQDDPGVFGVNYKNEPLQFRLGKDCDPAFSFSSFEHGDPITPILRAYEGDPIRIRLLQGAQEESHSFNVHGLKWLEERADLDSKLDDQRHVGISESFTFESYLPRSGDYLWAFETEEDLWNGLWGLIRAYGQKVPDLVKLPDRPIPNIPTGAVPDVCDPRPDAKLKKLNPPPSPLKTFDIVAFQVPIQYNSYGDHDPYAIVFALREDQEAILKGKKNPEPLVIRANVGDTVEVTLTSELKRELFPFQDGIYPYPDVKEQACYPPSLRISLHPQLIDFDVKTSSGETVGFNGDQTVGPGEKRTYRWFVDSAHGACGLWDMADIRNHKSQGAFGAFIAEPRGSTYHDPYSLCQIKTGARAVIRNPFLPDIREFVLIMHDGVRLLDKCDQVIVDPVASVLLEDEPEEESVDTYDQGSHAFNYRNERLINRYNEKPVLHQLFSSKTFRDPATPLLEAYAGEPVTIRYLYPAERRRTQTFHFHGHQWRSDVKDVDSRIDSTIGYTVTGKKQDLELIGGAGGIKRYPGDYMYRSGNIQWGIEKGLWGIFRVYEYLQEHLPPLGED
ncbi:multicopper oxidase domain-containing protein [Halobacillus locisalis]|uniref:Multicopper oxidase domain-containing protein n=1 Tax=Halobacillus locisalis TaxID=220753 RepID=A0A838CVC4_9BACI|nr:multicopper oxidase domain-containing protein [Halobacillus locisalis]MBA2176082.1 multicopper oxidase domain-containing protein [Halobacillus locisalis]